MPGIIGHKSVKHRKSRRTSNGPAMTTPIAITNLSVGGTTLTITFDQAVSMSGVPGIVTNVGTPATGATQTAPNTIELTYGVGVISSVIVPFQDAAIRNESGGYVLAGTYPIA